MFDTVEIYPPNTPDTQLLIENLNKEIQVPLETVNYIGEKYAKLVSGADITELLSDTLLKLITETGSKDGFVAIVEYNGNQVLFHYVCIYLDISGLPFKSQVHECKIQLSKHSLLNRSILAECNVISNDPSSDPRAIGITNIKADHPKLDSYVGIPLVVASRIIGQLGLANRAAGYSSNIVSTTQPLVEFCGQCLQLQATNKQHLISKEIKIKQEVGSLKGLFIATMSHEIRTPLNGIVGMARLLADSSGLSNKQHEYIRILNECSVQLLELVNDIIDFSKITGGTMTLNCAPFSLRECISSTIDIISQRAHDKGLELRKIIPASLPETINGDSRRLKQILINLLGNAIKFTDTGYIELIVSSLNVDSTDPLDPKMRNIIFNVRDTGIGILPKNHQRIFEVFTKLEGAVPKNFMPGAGLGLAISKQLVGLMGGEISVESDGISGSTFKFNVIMQDETNIKVLLETYEELLSDKKVLVVDDREDNRVYLMEILYSWGMDCMAFSSAREALTFISLRPNFAIAIIDISMPHMSGIELVQRMREQGLAQPIIGLSSIGTDLQGKDWFDYFTVKPISKHLLFNMILKCLLNKTRVSPVGPVSRRYSPSESMRIIVAEDDYYNQVLMTEMLKTLDYDTITIVNNGQKCVDAIKKNHFDICFMDIKMPIMDGLEATRIIKQMPQPPFIVAVSASVLESDKTRCFNAGMDAYIPKPIQKDKLASVINMISAKLEQVSAETC